eukprot:6020990-Prymnesium_polylepis.1
MTTQERDHRRAPAHSVLLSGLAGRLTGGVDRPATIGRVATEQVARAVAASRLLATARRHRTCRHVAAAAACARA